MAIQAAAYKNFNIRKQASEALAQQLASQQKKESGFGTFLSIAAPLAASFLLPGIGTALVGGLGGMGGMGAGLASAFGGGAFGGGAMGTMLGGLLSGGAKAAGTYAIGEGLEGIGRNQGYGADVDEIDLSKFGRRGVKGEKLGKENLQGSLDAMEEGQRKSALMAGLTTGVDQMGGFDKIKDMSAGLGEKLTGKGTLFDPAAEGLGMGKAAGGTDLAASVIPKDLQQVQSIADTPLTEMPTPGFTSPFATEGAPSLNLMTGDSTGNLLDQLIQPSAATQGSSILDSMTQYPQEILDLMQNNPDITQEQIEALMASMRG